MTMKFFKFSLGESVAYISSSDENSARAVFNDKFQDGPKPDVEEVQREDIPEGVDIL